MAGEANAYVMVTTFVPLSDQELDAWIEDACRDVTIPAVANHRIRRLVQEVVTGRAMLRSLAPEPRPTCCRYCGAAPYKAFDGACTNCGEPSK